MDLVGGIRGGGEGGEAEEGEKEAGIHRSDLVGGEHARVERRRVRGCDEVIALGSDDLILLAMNQLADKNFRGLYGLRKASTGGPCCDGRLSGPG